MTSSIVLSSRGVLAHHAKSFKWASFFLPPDARDDAAVLYAFCRYADDLADESASYEAAASNLADLRKQLSTETDRSPLVSALIELSERRGMKLDYVYELLEGMLSDTRPVRTTDDAELLKYCYRAAGTVGLMMCPILGVDDAQAHAHAIDLGMGMQLTNICRDVLEDSKRDRVYLPESRLVAAGTSQREILDGTADREAVASVVADLLELANRYYESAGVGMHFIPRRTRFAIHVAAALYQDIGKMIEHTYGFDSLQGRAFVPSSRKIRLVASNAIGFFFGSHRSVEHDSDLHLDLRGLPGIH